MHPYKGLPEEKFWRKFVSETPWSHIEFVGSPKFVLSAQTKLSAAGSCFAQHINRHMRKRGLRTFQAEHVHPLVEQGGGESGSYEAFPARFGNIYTSRQCLEIFRQAFGLREMVEDFVCQDGRFYDLLRPNAIPGGFSSVEEAKADRVFHLGKVREMFERSDVFVFTLGLTESWYNALGSYTYPVCPGTARGDHVSDIHRFRNLKHADVVADLTSLITESRQFNPGLKFIFTVSPVPLVATHSKHNVLTASVYSKSVLRAACGEVCDQFDGVQYFPSYEIVSHVASFGQYLASDLREVTERGVSHVMRYFFATFYPDRVAGVANADPSTTMAAAEPALEEPNIRKMLESDCEEMFNDFHRVPSRA